MTCDNWLPGHFRLVPLSINMLRFQVSVSSFWIHWNLKQKVKLKQPEPTVWKVMSEHDYLILDVNRGGLCCGSLAFSLCLSKILDTYRTTPRGFHQVNLYHLSSRKKKMGETWQHSPQKTSQLLGWRKPFKVVVMLLHGHPWQMLTNAHLPAHLGR